MNEDVYHRARVQAAGLHTSVSAMVGRFLEEAAGEKQKANASSDWSAKRFAIQKTTVGLLDAALVAKDRWKLLYWDAAIIEAARLSGCETVLSEDLNPGQNFDGVRVQDPFA